MEGAMIRIKRIQIPQLPTEKDRRLYVYLPRDYSRSNKHYPVLYMFDGHNVFYDSHATFGKSWGMKEYLEKSKLPIILVSIECNPEGNRRLNEYSPWDIDVWDLGHLEGLGKITMDWMTKDLKPMIDSKYRTLPGREDTLVAGSSMGGLMALYAVTQYNDVYSRAAALSPCFWAGGEALMELLAKPVKDPTRVHMDYGSGELEEGEERIDLTDMFKGAGLLAGAGAEVAARVVPGAVHNEAAWEKRIPIFMDYLLGEDQ